MTVLIINDDVEDHVVLSEAFYEIDPAIILQSASTCDQGLAFLNADPLPDLILLDDNMPMVSGVDCLKKMREDERLKSIPVIFYCTFDVRHLTDIKNFGADFLVKPSDYSELVRALRKIIVKR